MRNSFGKGLTRGRSHLVKWWEVVLTLVDLGGLGIGRELEVT